MSRKLRRKLGDYGLKNILDAFEAEAQALSKIHLTVTNQLTRLQLEEQLLEQILQKAQEQEQQQQQQQQQRQEEGDADSDGAGVELGDVELEELERELQVLGPAAGASGSVQQRGGRQQRRRAEQ